VLQLEIAISLPESVGPVRTGPAPEGPTNCLRRDP